MLITLLFFYLLLYVVQFLLCQVFFLLLLIELLSRVLFLVSHSLIKFFILSLLIVQFVLYSFQHTYQSFNISFRELLLIVEVLDLLILGLKVILYLLIFFSIFYYIIIYIIVLLSLLVVQPCLSIAYLNLVVSQILIHLFSINHSQHIICCDLSILVIPTILINLVFMVTLLDVVIVILDHHLMFITLNVVTILSLVSITYAILSHWHDLIVIYLVILISEVADILSIVLHYWIKIYILHI